MTVSRSREGVADASLGPIVKPGVGRGLVAVLQLLASLSADGLVLWLGRVQRMLDCCPKDELALLDDIKRNRTAL
ncbi:hypothetical protein [Agrococcus casei]|uniref:hypothetical protein n=1 Tax=Agrococcus casei TaxID=343512 RepID=UPI003F8E61BE